MEEEKRTGNAKEEKHAVLFEKADSSAMDGEAFHAEKRVEIAKKAGFCYGVRRALDLTVQAADGTDGPVYTLGELIHNEQVIAGLRERGIHAVASPEELARLPVGTVIIRSHGVSRAVYEALAATGHTILDGTCPHVKRIHRIAAEYSAKGYRMLIIGRASHPEVLGIAGWCSGRAPWIVETAEEANMLPVLPGEPVCIVEQTTFQEIIFKELVEIISEKGYHTKVCSTICTATLERQDAARALAENADAMIVIGGRKSSNTRKLYEICSGICPNTYFIQTKEDLAQTNFCRFNYVGITAGASTPNKIIEEVQNSVRKKF